MKENMLDIFTTLMEQQQRPTYADFFWKTFQDPTVLTLVGIGVLVVGGLSYLGYSYFSSKPSKKGPDPIDPKQEFQDAFGDKSPKEIAKEFLEHKEEFDLVDRSPENLLYAKEKIKTYLCEHKKEILSTEEADYIRGIVNYEAYPFPEQTVYTAVARLTENYYFELLTNSDFSYALVELVMALYICPVPLVG